MASSVLGGGAEMKDLDLFDNKALHVRTSRQLRKSSIITNQLLIRPNRHNCHERQMQPLPSVTDGNSNQMHNVRQQVEDDRYLRRGTDVILLKFLKSCDLIKPLDALVMIQRTMKWRKGLAIVDNEEDENNINNNKEEEEEKKKMEFGFRQVEEAASCMKGRDVDKKLGLKRSTRVRVSDDHQESTSQKKSSSHAMKWRVQKLMISLKAEGLLGQEQVIHIVDLKGFRWSAMPELCSDVKQLLSVHQESHINPDEEFISKIIIIFINVPFGHYAIHGLFSHLVSPTRTNGKFIFVRSSNVTKTLLKFIDIEDLPMKFGGLKREEDDELSSENRKASELLLKGGATGVIEIPILEVGVTVVWDMTVVGLMKAKYREEFVPEDEGSYKILIQRRERLHESIRNSFYFKEQGKLVLTVENTTHRKKIKVFYRFKIKRAPTPIFI